MCIKINLPFCHNTKDAIIKTKMTIVGIFPGSPILSEGG